MSFGDTSNMFLPEISEKAFIITDCEDAFRNAIKSHFPGVPLVRCWNHFWKSTDRELFLQPNKQLFDLQLSNKIKGYTNNSGHKIEAWSQEFLDYYNSSISPDIESLAAWNIKPISGVKIDTISASEDSSHGSSEQTSSNSGTCSEEEIVPILEVANTIKDLNLDDSPKTISVSSNTCTSTVKDDSIENLSNDELDLDITFELKNRYNSKIGRAMWFVNKNRVKLDLDLKILEDVMNGKLLLQSKMICKEYSQLSDIFIKNFDLEGLKPMFNAKAWNDFKTIYDLKLKKSTCQLCKNLCSEKSIECDICNYWYHFTCANVSRYHQSGK
ncbi:unnamed protein product, partial [Brachionus calyciflorus]